FLKTQWVAPLGSIALIFNFIFAKILVGTRIVRHDVWGTVIVMISVIWIVVFGGMSSSGSDVEETLTLTELKALFSRPIFIIYFSILNIVIGMFLSLGLYAFWAITMDDTSGQLRKDMKARMTNLLGSNRFGRASGLSNLEGEESRQPRPSQQQERGGGEEGEEEGGIEEGGGGTREQQLQAERDLRMKKIVAMIMSACGGLLASETLLLAKSGVRLVTSTVQGHNQFEDSLSYFILSILVLTAVLQVYCLNTALKIYDSVLVVPVFYGFYTTFGLVNSVIYLNQLQNYPPWVLLLILLGIGSLIFGVRMLSAPKPDLTNSLPHASTSEEEGEDDINNESDEKELKLKSGSGGTLSSSGEGVGGGGGGSTSEKKMAGDGGGSGSDNNDDKAKLMAYCPFNNRRGTGSSSVTTKGSFVLLNPTGKQDDLATTTTALYSNHSRTSSLPQHQPAITKSLTIHNKRGSLDIHGTNGNSIISNSQSRDTSPQRQRPRLQRIAPIPKIDTSLNYGSSSFTRGRSLTPKDSNATTTTASTVTALRRVSSSSSSSAPGYYPRPMSPSEFRAQYTNSPFPLKPKHLQERDRERQRTGSYCEESNNSGDGDGRANSPRRITGNSKIDQIFEDLNPFRAFRRRESLAGDGSTITTTTIGAGFGNVSLTALGGGGGRRASTSSLPTSPSQIYEGGGGRGRHNHHHNHRRQDSFTGRPSEWEEPNRLVRHSMLFGEHGRSSSLGRGSRSLSRTGSPVPVPLSGENSSPRVHMRHHSNAELGSGTFGTGSLSSGSLPFKKIDRGGIGPLSANPSSSSGNEENPMSPRSQQPAAAPPTHRYLPNHHYRSSSSSGSYHHYPTTYHGRQLSFTTKNENGLGGAGVGAGAGGLSFESGTDTSTANGTSTNSTTVAGDSVLTPHHPLLLQQQHVQHQLQQLQQHQHYPTSQLQHSLTTSSSISTIGSIMVPSMSTNSLAAVTRNGTNGGGMPSSPS
ncbi:hypothetical protein BG004_000202, partial [Podila humilis]